MVTKAMGNSGERNNRMGERFLLGRIQFGPPMTMIILSPRSQSSETWAIRKLTCLEPQKDLTSKKLLFHFIN